MPEPTEVVLDARGWQNEVDFLRALLAALGAPEGHPADLDAIDDSVGDPDVRWATLPLRIIVEGVSDCDDEAKMALARFTERVADWLVEGLAVDLELR